MRRNLVCLFLCLILLAVPVFSGCSGQSSGGLPGNTDSKYSEFITVDVFDALANSQGIQSGWFAKIVKDKFNMELNIIAPNVAGGGDILYHTRSAAGNLGDLIISGTDNGRFASMVNSGLLLDMTDLLKGKDVLSNYESAIRNVNKIAGREGIYGIPSEISNQSPEVAADGIEPLVSPYVRWDAYTAAGSPAIDSLEAFIPVMKAMQEAVPESDSGKKTYAISLFKDWDGNMMVGAKNYAALFGYNETGFCMLKADGTDIQDMMDDDGVYVRALKFLFQANQAGLIDPESTTQNYETLANKYRDGQILTSLWSYQGSALYNTAENKESGKGFMPVYIEGTAPYSLGCYSEGNGKTVIAIGSKAKDPERLADFIDWLYSPEGMEIAGQAGGAAGPEGLTWEMDGDTAVLTEFGKKALPGNDVEVPEEWGGGSWKDGISALNFKPLCLVDIDPRSQEPYMVTMWSSVLNRKDTKLDRDWQAWAGGAKTTVEFLEEKNALSVAAGTSYIPPEESADITTLRNQCKTVITDRSWKMIYAEDEAEFDSILENTQKTLKGLGYEQVLAVDLQNAKDEAASRNKAVKDYRESHP
ncbi:MAG: extracellular solute-binding protein [Lachnospiraceae bacterium]